MSTTDVLQCTEYVFGRTPVFIRYTSLSLRLISNWLLKLLRMAPSLVIGLFLQTAMLAFSTGKEC